MIPRDYISNVVEVDIQKLDGKERDISVAYKTAIETQILRSVAGCSTFGRVPEDAFPRLADIRTAL